MLAKPLLQVSQGSVRGQSGVSLVTAESTHLLFFSQQLLVPKNVASELSL